MRKLLITGLFALAFALPASASPVVPIVMKDPGCHWFSANGKFTRSDIVTAGRVKLVDQDAAALKVASRHGMRHIPVGKSIVVGPGTYVIMMVGQASTDNYLKLTVN